MCSKRHNFQPTHVYANLSPRLFSSDDEQRKGENDTRRIEVSGAAEFTLPPDQCILTVIIINKKEKAEEAKESVNRRLDYVTQTCVNHGVQSCDIEVTKNMSRVNGRGWFLMEAQVDAVFHNDLHKCLQISNLFVEKLDKCVKVLPVTLQHNKRRIEAVRKQTCITALSNAKQKAVEVCRLMGLCLGKPVFITENIIREWKGEDFTESAGVPENVEPPATTLTGLSPCGPIDVQRRMKEQSLTIKAEVTATFELFPKQAKSSKKQS